MAGLGGCPVETECSHLGVEKGSHAATVKRRLANGRLRVHLNDGHMRPAVLISGNRPEQRAETGPA